VGVWPCVGDVASAAVLSLLASWRTEGTSFPVNSVHNGAIILSPLSSPFTTQTNQS